MANDSSNGKIKVIDVNNPEDERLVTYYGFWYCCENSKQYYYSTQLMTPELEHAIDDKAIIYWKISYNKYHQTYVLIQKIKLKIVQVLIVFMK